ncbi:hypothetical protein Nepgr_031807 [Nepenthes gracilis]|uniref:UVR domain-containing protein n=1 Tax=Nepenthes gracilis TaxID=150966 RepID=A0AAD3TIT6_NEPGR|nr:hypothetical protein Nepgr_031807 [Nepenthes gracilis]
MAILLCHCLSHPASVSRSLLHTDGCKTFDRLPIRHYRKLESVQFSKIWTVMEDKDKDNMGSLFEGMVLFTSSQMTGNDVSDVHFDHVQSVEDSNATTTTSLSLSSSEPLDENLFSDLTVINPLQTEVMGHSVQPDRFPMATSTTKTDGKAAPAASVSRQISRRKRRASLRIGYGRDAQLSDDYIPLSNSLQSLSLDEKSSPVVEACVQTCDLNAEREEKQDSRLYSTTASASLAYQSEKLHYDPLPHVTEGVDSSSIDMVKSSYEQMDTDGGLKSTPDNSVVSATAHVKEENTNQKPEKGEEKSTCDNLENKYEQICAEISEKLRHAKELAASISGARKDSGKRRREASENVDLASLRYGELEKKLSEACEAEDFETAENLSVSLAAAEKENEHLLSALRDTEADCDAIDSKMQEALQCQIAAEEECISLLQCFSKDAESNADLTLENLEKNVLKETDKWLSSVEALEVTKMELEIQSNFLIEAHSGLDGSIEHVLENEIREKELLCEKKKQLELELERLFALVRAKETEITENNSKIEELDKRIAEVVSGFEEMRSGIAAKFEHLQLGLSEIESQSEALSMKKEENDELFSQEKERGEKFRKLAAVSADVAKAYEKDLGLRNSLLVSVLKSREEKLRLARTEEKILADIQMLRQEISAARASLQELSSKKSIIQQEIVSFKQRMFFIDKRIPELEAEKKVAAVSRNFREAGRIAAEAKTLSNEKESEQIKMEGADAELGKIEDAIRDTTAKVQETEGLVLSKDREAAVARLQRLRLAAGAALAERRAALELGDLEEAKILLAEAEAAESEAKQLELSHNFSIEDFGSLPAHFISMELISCLEGDQLAELAASGGHPFSP